MSILFVASLSLIFSMGFQAATAQQLEGTIINGTASGSILQFSSFTDPFFNGCLGISQVSDVKAIFLISSNIGICNTIMTAFAHDYNVNMIVSPTNATFPFGPTWPVPPHIVHQIGMVN